MINNEKKYKKTLMDEKYSSYCNNLARELQMAAKENPRYFWKVLGSHKRKRQPNIHIESLYDFFQRIEHLRFRRRSVNFKRHGGT